MDRQPAPSRAPKHCRRTGSSPSAAGLKAFRNSAQAPLSPHADEADQQTCLPPRSSSYFAQTLAAKGRPECAHSPTPAAEKTIPRANAPNHRHSLQFSWKFAAKKPVEQAVGPNSPAAQEHRRGRKSWCDASGSIERLLRNLRQTRRPPDRPKSPRITTPVVNPILAKKCRLPHRFSLPSKSHSQPCSRKIS